MPTTTNLFTHSIRVYYEDTDAGGIVYYANYLKFFERTRTEWFRSLGFEQQQLAETTNCIFVVKNVQVEYIKPAQLDDLLIISSNIKKIGKSYIIFEQSCQRSDGVLPHTELPTLSQGTFTVVCVNKLTLKPTAIPAPLLDCLSKLTTSKEAT